MGIWRLFQLLIAILIFASQAQAVDQPVISGMIARGTNVSSFTITVKIGSVEKFGLQTGETDLFKNRIRIYINGKSDAVPFQGDAPVAAMPFVVSQSTDLQITNHESNANLRDFTYSLLIAASSYKDFRTFLDENADKKSLKVTVKYLEGNTEVTKKENEVISISAAVVSSAPENVVAKGTHRQLVIDWSTPGTVSWSGTPASTKPSDITLIAIEKTSTLTDLPAYIFSDAADSNDTDAADGTCSFDSGFADGTACVSCSNSKAYLNTEELSKLSASGVFVAQSSPDSGTASISGLENGKRYAIFAYYEPGGLSRSACWTASPQANTSYSELNGEDDASLTDPKCFIATAAYGTVLHKNLKPLRWFRDHILQKSSLGKTFVNWYYEHGPKAAAYVRTSPVLQALVRGALWIPVLVLSACMTLANSTLTLQQYLLILVISVMAIIAGLRLIGKARGAS